MIAEMPKNLTVEEKEAIAKHNIEMEKALKIIKGMPMTVEEADKQNANPKYKELFIPDPKGTYLDKQGNRFSKNPDFKPADKQYGINCQTCAPAYALRLRGFDVTAKGNTSGSKLEYLSKGMNVWKVWKNPDGTQAKHTSFDNWMTSKQYLKMTSKRYQEFFEEVCKDEGVYELSIGWKTGGGHATILQRFANGELRYIEPQADNSKGSVDEWKNIKYLCENGKSNQHSCRGIMRVDNKLFNIEFIDIFDK